ncbi:muramoyltetrapeptide carboxypeptidase [Allocatelliglobosispora scoriae]|uniref:Muramoyltetrapeptide carboxypeptidase n=1 Tax=Allocatelliglobosispora scoriae TaxID=643052 RepID=A0A841BK98_9ACTN|nr:LD-carboxypeptidase [Allocatelliglobosispora scoriae]MBB5869527.1 muramoyltetrapeptide carboxypeptidase [Allocatelliglobosispora scoriae]
MTLHPAPLQAGDAVALVCPAGPVPHDRLDIAVGVLASWGLEVRVAPHVRLKHDTYLAGTDEQRLGDLNAALADPEIRGVLAVRGGYGMQRIVDRVDFDAVRRDPKLVMGFSDITALHLALWAETGLATVLGPVVAQFDKGADSPTTLGARHSLMSAEPVEVRADPAESTASVRVGGVATGTLIGGNLCLIDATIGTRHSPELDGAILLIEDVFEAPYKVDRMLTHLLRSGLLDRVAGVAVGQFTDCADGWPVTAAEVIGERLGGLGVPVLGGLPIGHGVDNIAIGHGVQATLDATAGTLTVAPATHDPRNS